MRVLPLDLNEMWAFEVDFEYSSGMLLHIETRLEIREPELEKDIMSTSLKDDSNGDMGSDVLDSIEQYGNQLRSSEVLDSVVKDNDEAGPCQFYFDAFSVCFLLLELAFTMCVNDQIIRSM